MKVQGEEPQHSFFFISLCGVSAYVTDADIEVWKSDCQPHFLTSEKGKTFKDVVTF